MTLPELARTIARQAPELKDLSQAQLEQIAKAVVIDNLKADLSRQVRLAGIEYGEELSRFLSSASRTGSAHTRRAYEAGIARLNKWAGEKGIPVLELAPADADDFISDLTKTASASSVRLYAGACSAFFTWLERRHPEIRNPFRGSKARPAKKTKIPSIPTEGEVARILKAVPEDFRLAVELMYRLGLRVGTLPSLEVNGTRYVAGSKGGKRISGNIPEQCLKILKENGQAVKAPFKGHTASALAERFKYYTQKMRDAGTIATAYSVHDLRHAFAVKEYRTHKDILALQKKLGHASIQITQHYLASIGEEG